MQLNVEHYFSFNNCPKTFHVLKLDAGAAPPERHTFKAFSSFTGCVSIMFNLSEVNSSKLSLLTAPRLGDKSENSPNLIKRKAHEKSSGN